MQDGPSATFGLGCPEWLVPLDAEGLLWHAPIMSLPLEASRSRFSPQGTDLLTRVIAQALGGRGPRGEEYRHVLPANHPR